MRLDYQGQWREAKTEKSYRNAVHICRAHLRQERRAPEEKEDGVRPRKSQCYVRPERGSRFSRQERGADHSLIPFIINTGKTTTQGIIGF